ncbi:unnamed protein product [Symbiodinium natans]|uniref:Uncharacterized protein n=1 Tax=Symbiodinium natans TaxID=878477 RepID=A0A812LAC1_9DINO|nr:unnamed protein product [Symbiodinium natans]
MVLPADHREDKLLPRPYTSGAVSAISAEAAFSAENSLFSTRPSTSACSRATSSRSFRPRPWCRNSRRSKGARSNLGESSMSPTGSLWGSQTPLPRDQRGYETLEQLLQPAWQTPADLLPDLKPDEEPQDSGDEDTAQAGHAASFRDGKRNAVVLGVGKTIWSLKKQLQQQEPASKVNEAAEKPAEKPHYQQKRHALKQAPTQHLLAMRGQMESQADESSSSATSDDAASASSDSVDPMLATDIGDLLPQTSSPWPTFTKATTDAKLQRRGGLDADMIAMAEFAVAAQRAALREAEEASLPVQVLPGVYFGHMDSPQSTLLPKTPKVGRLRKLEHKKLTQDNVHQRKLLSLPQEDLHGV